MRKRETGKKIEGRNRMMNSDRRGDREVDRREKDERERETN